MIQAAINPETKEFLGLIIPAEHLIGPTISIHGTAEDWQALLRGEKVDPQRVGVIFYSTKLFPSLDANPMLQAEPPEPVEVEGL
jgi:hypothetical protein